MKTAVVLTTINVPRVLDTYTANCRKYGHEGTAFIIVGDLKTPGQAGKYILSLQKKGYECIYLGIREQENWLKPFPALKALLPYNSIQRRNIGYLYAVGLGAELIISIDDDNYVLPGEDYIGSHKIAGSFQNVPAVSASTGWFNICSFLKTRPKRVFYHRGFPFDKRWQKQQVRFRLQNKRVAVNVGLWTGDPDVDTVTRLEEPFTVTGLDPKHQKIALCPDTCHPFNSQNTAFIRELLPCFYLITLGNVRKDLRVDNFRYDDIWMSYFTKKIVDHMNDQIVFGRPIVDQKRNPHDYLTDFQREIFPILMTPKLTDIIDKVRFSAGSYGGCYMELAEHLQSYGLRQKALSSLEKECLRKISKDMRVWLTVCSRVLGSKW